MCYDNNHKFTISVEHSVEKDVLFVEWNFGFAKAGVDREEEAGDKTMRGIGLLLGILLLGEDRMILAPSSASSWSISQSEKKQEEAKGETERRAQTSAIG